MVSKILNKCHFKIGNPYQIFGVSYIPQNYEDYQEIGTASWYGDDFHGKATANGEVYNMQSMTAAHPTLPLPSLVRVTNLRNNKSVIVRVNDRGPFARNRVIDVSEKAADFLEFKNQGTTQVKVQLLRNETDELLEKLKIAN
jgi:rare lipoprotein A